MNTKKKVALILLIAVLAVPTGYLALQFWNVVTYHEYRKGLIVQVRLTGLVHVIDSLAIDNGYFPCYLTFSNPTTEALTLNKLYVNYWDGTQRWQQYLVASGDTPSETLTPGTTNILLNLEFNPDYAGDVLLVQQPVWEINYSPKLGPTAYAMRANVENWTIQTEGPFYAWDIDETESTITAYMASTVGLWAIPFEILAAATIFRSRKEEGAALLQYKVLSVIYGLQGFGFIVAPFWGAVVSFLIPRLPPQDFYYSSFAGAFVALLLFAFALSISMVFFLTAYGSLRKRGWAKKLAFSLSLPSLLTWSYVEFHLVRAWFFEGLSTMYYLSLIFLFLTLVIANAIVVSVLIRQYMITRQAR